MKGWIPYVLWISACHTPPARSPVLDAEVGEPTLGQALASCIPRGGKLQLQLRATCTTTAPLVVTIRSGDPVAASLSDRDWKYGPQPYAHAQLYEDRWATVEVLMPPSVPATVRILAINVQSRCYGTEPLQLKHGDALCRL